MKLGDLIRIKPEDSGDSRRVGVVLRLDVYRGTETLGPLRIPEPIIEVLWNNTQTGWILKSRVETISESW